VLSGVVVLDEVESDSLEGGLDPVGGMRAEDPLKVIGVGHALLRRVPRALTGATVACAGWRRLNRIPKETSGESGGVGVFVKCTAQGTHRCDESLCWVAEAQSEPEGESCGDTDVRPVYVGGVGVAWASPVCADRIIVAWVWRGRLRMTMENDRVKLVRLWRGELLAAVMGCWQL
jgi:hypothetical protein